MAVEIERKFLTLDESYRSMAESCTFIAQGYLNTDPDRTVRVRIAADRGFLTVKSRNVGARRGEWEYEIPLQDARELLECCGNTVIEKNRYVVPAGNGLRWEVDEFLGRHQGLTVAEIELESEDSPVPAAPFVGQEVTGDIRYYNSSLCKASGERVSNPRPSSFGSSEED